MADFFETQAKRIYGLGELEAEALDVLREVVRQTDRGENPGRRSIRAAKAIVERYDRAIMRGHQDPNVVSLRRE
ncbi:MAG: hypothetical protein ACRECX_11725 [Methyloceanibacter sp.]|uniref:hypothetical protein n=1 Tax=Methyloceanibacter sp. TaxID=1965321 RepID=UPI003D6D7B78